jgi:predicted nucleotidyltransferase component of viral defense system
MNLFDTLVTKALENQPNLSSLRVVVEKELLHHDILRVLSNNGLLKNLTFIGGTAIRACYGGVRLSEDLDFTGGNNFNRDALSEMGKILIENLNDKYGLPVKVSEPIKDHTNVDTWKIKIETKPLQTHLPAQRINIDICALPSYEKQPMMLLNPYGVDMGTSGLIIQVESLEEIYADKIVAFALRSNRIKYRDLWDILWLHQKGIKPRFKLIPKKLEDRNCKIEQFLNLFNERLNRLTEDKEIQLEFKQEMHRFLSIAQINQIVEQDNLWSFITYLMKDLARQISFA